MTHISETKRHTDRGGTITNRLFGALQVIAERESKKVAIVGKGRPVELFQFGDERAILIRSFPYASTFEELGTMEVCVEAYQYKRMHWWREAIEAVNAPLRYLDTPVVQVAKDAGIQNPASIFIPSGVVAAYGLEGKDALHLQDLEKRVRDWIVQAITPRVAEQYTIGEEFGLLRLQPLTEQAQEAKLQDNACYEHTVAAIGSVIPLLETTYATLRE